MCRSIKSVLGENDTHPQNTGNSLSTDDLAAFFSKMVDDIHASINDAAPATFSIVPENCSHALFDQVTVNELKRIICDVPAKQSSLDYCPTWLLKDCVDLLAVFTDHLQTFSRRGNVWRYHHHTMTFTIIIQWQFHQQLLKKPGFDNRSPPNYRPVSNLSVISKLLELSR